MSEFENQNMNEGEELDNILILNDEEGNEVEFEFLDIIEYEGEEYVVLLPVEDEDAEEAGEVVILKLEDTDNEEEESYVSVEDEEVLKVEKDGNTYYYLKSQSDIQLGANSLINIDTSTNNYYFVRFVKVDNINPKEEGATYNSSLVTPYKGQTVAYSIAQALATSASNYSNCIIYYLDLYNVTVHDDDFYQYIFDTYGYPEEE